MVHRQSWDSFQKVLRVPRRLVESIEHQDKSIQFNTSEENGNRLVQELRQVLGRSCDITGTRAGGRWNRFARED
jgi:hypothetical protein